MCLVNFLLVEILSSSTMSRCVTLSTGSVTRQEQQTATSSGVERLSPVTLKLRKPKQEKRVNWTNDTIDNEHLNKKKSKCCCVYEKPKQMDESSSESEGECDHCSGHVEVKKNDIKKDGLRR